jgi:hypothetical protein
MMINTDTFFVDVSENKIGIKTMLDCHECKKYEKAMEYFGYIGFTFQMFNIIGKKENVKMTSITHSSLEHHYVLLLYNSGMNGSGQMRLCGESINHYIHVGLKKIRDEIPIPVKDIRNIVIEMLVGVLLKE